MAPWPDFNNENNQYETPAKNTEMLIETPMLCAIHGGSTGSDSIHSEFDSCFLVQSGPNGRLDMNHGDGSCWFNLRMSSNQLRSVWKWCIPPKWCLKFLTGNRMITGSLFSNKPIFIFLDVATVVAWHLQKRLEKKQLKWILHHPNDIMQHYTNSKLLPPWSPCFRHFDPFFRSVHSQLVCPRRCNRTHASGWCCPCDQRCNWGCTGAPGTLGTLWHFQIFIETWWWRPQCEHEQGSLFSGTSQAVANNTCIISLIVTIRFKCLHQLLCSLGWTPTPPFHPLVILLRLDHWKINPWNLEGPRTTRPNVHHGNHSGTEILYKSSDGDLSDKSSLFKIYILQFCFWEILSLDHLQVQMGSGIPISTTYPMETGASRASIRLGLRRTVPFGIPSMGLYHNFWHFFIGATGDKPWDFEVIIYI